MEETYIAYCNVLRLFLLVQDAYNNNANIIHKVVEEKVIIVNFMAHFQQTYVGIDNTRGDTKVMPPILSQKL
jgi:archaellum component FlaF (FlaF/FlaG flagellin family)